jgi:hypothetical protein
LDIARLSNTLNHREGPWLNIVFDDNDFDAATIRLLERGKAFETSL